MKTKNLSGLIRKTARVYNNDPKKSVVSLTIKAFVKKPVTFTPKKISLEGVQGDIVTKTVTIISHEEAFLEIEPDGFSLDENIKYRIEEIEKGRVFEIYFQNVPDLHGNFKGTFRLKTNYHDAPLIYIPVKAVFSKKTNEIKETSQNPETDLPKP